MNPRSALMTESERRFPDLMRENKRLRDLVNQGRLVVVDFMPNIGQCALQDYARLNDFLLQSGKIGR